MECNTKGTGAAEEDAPHTMTPCFYLFLCIFAAPALAAAPVAGSTLYLDYCSQSGNELQEFAVAGNTVTAAGGSLCVAYTGASPQALALLPCDGSVAQRWTFNASTGAFVGAPVGTGCLVWNGQGGPRPGLLSAGSLVSTWSCVPLAWNDVFAPGVPQPGLLGCNSTGPNNETFSGLCVTATAPVPPPVGTPEQIQWALKDIACFLVFNMATSAGTQGCSGCGGPPPDISLWNPYALDTDVWVSAGLAMGCSRFVLVAKHACGFVAWNSTLASYPYSSDKAPHPIDIVRPLVESVKRLSNGTAGYGFYYSVVSNQLTNVCGGVVNPNPSPGQMKVTQAEYDAIVIHHLTELWGLFGPLAEVWFDGGYPASESAALRKLFSTLQPTVVAFQGFGLMPSPLRWVGSETGYAPYPCWSTSSDGAAGAGDPNGNVWCPAETDFTLLSGDQWFYNGLVDVRSPAELRNMYEVSTGHNTALIVGLAPFPNGSLPRNQAAAAQTMGDYVRGCYGAPLASSSGAGVNTYTLTLSEGSPLVDRVLVAEDQTHGQLIRSFTLTGVMTNGTTVRLVNGTSVGNKYLAHLPSPLPLTSLTLNVTSVALLSPVGAPFIRNFAAFACSDVAAVLDARWQAEGWATSAG